MRQRILIIFILTISESAFAGALDGNYVSNMNNQMRISGSRYDYVPRAATRNLENVRGSGTVRNVGGNQYKFSGGNLKYTCTLTGATLVCDGGRRTWTRR